MYESPLHLLAWDGYSAKLLCSMRRAIGRRSYYQIRGAINKQTNNKPVPTVAVDGYSAKLLCSARRAMGRRSYYQIRGAINKQTNKQTCARGHVTCSGLILIVQVVEDSHPRRTNRTVNGSALGLQNPLHWIQLRWAAS